MITYKPGEFAFSKSGRDKGNLFVIIDEDREYVYLADGKYKTAGKPKKKNKKHVQSIHYEDDYICEKLKDGIPLNDEDIRSAVKKALKQFRTVD